MNERQFNLIHSLVGLSAECLLRDFIERAKEDFAPSAIFHGLLALEQNQHIALEDTQAGFIIVRLKLSARSVEMRACPLLRDLVNRSKGSGLFDSHDTSVLLFNSKQAHKTSKETRATRVTASFRWQWANS